METDFYSSYPRLRKRLSLVREVVARDFDSAPSSVRDHIASLLSSGGKMLRPAFCLLASEFGEPDVDKIASIAAAIEILHLATLVHDDVVDDAETRRGVPSVHRKAGKRNAVLIGDYLFTRSLLLVADFAGSANPKTILRAVSKICASEIGQSSDRFRTDVTEQTYLRRIKEKTANLFAVSAYAGAHESGCGKEVTHGLGKAAYCAGMAFQIRDDILDISGNEDEVGKPLSRDLMEGVITLPVIYALRDPEIRAAAGNGHIKDPAGLLAAVRGSDGPARAAAKADEYTGRALEELGRLPEGEARETFADLIRRMAVRDR